MALVRNIISTTATPHSLLKILAQITHKILACGNPRFSMANF